MPWRGCTSRARGGRSSSRFASGGAGGCRGRPFDRAPLCSARELWNLAKAEDHSPPALLRLDPKDSCAAGALRLARGRGGLARPAAALEQAAVHAGNLHEAATLTLRLAKVHEQRLGRRDRAALLYARAQRLDPELAEARFRALNCFTALRRFGQAKKLLDAAREHGRSPAPWRPSTPSWGQRSSTSRSSTASPWTRSSRR